MVQVALMVNPQETEIRLVSFLLRLQWLTCSNVQNVGTLKFSLANIKRLSIIENMNTVSISRDPFGRFNVVRQKAEGECAWCGQPAKFRYGINRDDKNKNEMQEKVFCSRSCERDYNS